MEERNVKLSLEKAKEWYKKGGELKEVALQAYSEEELKDNKYPHSWEEFCHNFRNKITDYYIDDNSNIVSIRSEAERLIDFNRNLCTSKEEAEAFRALMQLRQLRKAWIGDWKPDWGNDDYKGVIDVYKNKILSSTTINTSYTLSFPTYEMAQDFLCDFRDLLETAKPLL